MIPSKIIRGLAALGQSQESYGSLLIPIILGKLPADIRRSLAREHCHLEWTIDQLRHALLKEIKILEAGLNIEKHESEYTTPHNPTAAFYAGAKDGIARGKRNQNDKIPHCVYSNGQHSPLRCDVLTDPEKRLAIVKQANLCFNCLGHHKVSQCKSKYRCKTCTRKHHSSLCNPQKPPNNNTHEQTPETPKGQPIHATLTPATPTSRSILNNQETGTTACLLKTAISTVSLANQRAVANILFDEGA